MSSLVFDSVAARMYVGGDKDRIHVWDVQAQLRSTSHDAPKPLPPLTHTPGVNLRSQTLAISPNGRWLVAGLANPRVARWDLTSNQTEATVMENFTNWINSVLFTTDGDTLLVGDSDQQVKVLDTATWTVQRVLPGPAVITSVGATHDAIVATDVAGTLWRWSTTPRVLKQTPGSIWQFSSNKTGRWLVAAVGATDLAPRHLLVWDRTNLAAPPRRLLPPEGVFITTSAYLAPDEKSVYSGSKDGEVIRWAIADNGDFGAPTRHRVLPAGGQVVSIAINPKNSVMVVGDYGGDKSVIATLAGGVPTPITTIKTSIPQAMSFNADGSLFQVGTGQGVQLWDLDDPARPLLLRTITTSRVPLTSAFSSVQPNVLGVGCEDGTITTWDVTQPADPTKLETFIGPGSAVYALSFSNTGHELIAGSGDETLWLWHNAITQKTSDSLPINAGIGRTTEVRFINHETFVAAGASGQVRVWSTNPDSVRDDLCTRRGAALTDEEWAKNLPGIKPFDPCRR